jgi:hypothetical protein
MLACVSVVYAGCPCDGNACPLQKQTSILNVEVSAIVAGHPAIATVEKSVGVVAKVASTPVKVLARIAEKKPVRSALKAVAKKPVRHAVAGAVQLICRGE